MKVSTPSQYALLGSLSRGPQSGYDIKKAIGESTQHFWSESYGQIYPNLKKLSEAGLATSETEKQEGKPDRKVYTITPKGREALLEWLSKPPNRMPPRNELLLKLFFAQHTSPEVAAQHVEEYNIRLQPGSCTGGAIRLITPPASLGWAADGAEERAEAAPEVRRESLGGAISGRWA